MSYLSHRRDYLPPLTDEELRILGPPPPQISQRSFDERTGYIRNPHRASDAIRMELHAFDQFRRSGGYERQRALEIELARVNRMLPLREEFLQNPNMYESQEESEDDDWIEEWNRGMRQIEQEIDAGDYEISARQPPRPNLDHSPPGLTSAIKIESSVEKPVWKYKKRLESEPTETDERPTKVPTEDLPILPCRSSQSSSSSSSSSSSASSSHSQESPRPKRGRPKKKFEVPLRFSKREIVRRTRKSSDFRRANPRKCTRLKRNAYKT